MQIRKQNKYLRTCAKPINTLNFGNKNWKYQIFEQKIESPVTKIY